MHDMTLDLGDYADDPRFRVIDAGHLQAGDFRIASGDGLRWHVWVENEAGGGFHAFAGDLIQCLAYTLGEPVEVGPVGIQDWLHTDGRTYRHDPAITGMMPADSLRAGDVVDFPHIEAFEILGPAEIAHDELGLPNMGYPARRINGGFNVRFTYRSGDMAPVRFAR
jgi:hypothetical protein